MRKEVKTFLAISLFLLSLIFFFLRVNNLIVSLIFYILIPGFLVSSIFIKNDFVKILLAFCIGFLFISIWYSILSFTGIAITRTSSFLGTVLFYCISFPFLRKADFDLSINKYLFFSIVIVLIPFLLKSYTLNDVLIPSGNDAAAHTRKIVEIIKQGTLNYDPSPYVDMMVDYPIAYHSIIVFLSFFTNTFVTRLLIDFYLLCWILIPLTIYFVVKVISKKEFPAFLATLFCTTSFSLTEAFSWGGFPLSLSFFPLLLVIGLFIGYLNSKKLNFGFLASISLSLLILTHGHTTLIFGIFFLIIFLYTFIFKRSFKNISKLLIPIFIAGLVFLLFGISPLIDRIYKREAPSVSAIEDNLTFDRFLKYVMNNLAGYINKTYLISFFSLISLFFIIRKREKDELIIVLTSVLILLWAINNITIHFPIPLYSTLVSVVRVLILFYPFHAILAGLGGYYLYDFFLKKKPFRNHKTLIFSSVVILSLSSLIYPYIQANNYMSYYTTEYATAVTDSDLRAFDWIITNTAEESIFMNDLNPDAGFWIHTFTGRYTMFAQAAHIQDYGAIRRLFEKEDDLSSSVKQVISHNISYVFLGANPIYNKEHRIKFSNLVLSPFYELVYYDNGTAIFSTPYAKRQDGNDSFSVTEVLIDIGTEDSEGYLLDGWYGNEKTSTYDFVWAKENNSTIFVKLNPDIDYLMTIKMKTINICEEQLVSVKINNYSLSEFNLTNYWKEYTTLISHNKTLTNNVIFFNYSCSKSPENDRRDMSVTYDYIKLLPVS